MIRGYEPPLRLEPVDSHEFQWPAALLAGVIPGIILLIVPSGSPWSAFIFFAPVIVGRAIPPQTGLPILVIWLIHLAVATIYGLVISFVAMRFRKGKALLAGAIAGLVLYVLNFAIVSVIWPHLRGNEVATAFAHVVFGLIAAGAYRGLLKRKVPQPV